MKQKTIKFQILNLIMYFDLRGNTIKLILEHFENNIIVFKNRIKGITLSITKDTSCETFL